MNEKIKIGSLINGRYEILELVGSGGMADVYKARCLKLNRLVAIKFLKKEFLQDREFVERFDAEARAAAGITHPNIVSVYDVGLSDSDKYIVMEYVEGITLKEYIEGNGKLTWREAASVSGQISSALSCAHKNGIIHRDIKPHNIIITTAGSAKVTDFGIAKAVSKSTIVKNDGNILGSAHYFSPEQGVGSDVDKTTDIYSLGVVLFEMLTGYVPFENSNPLALALMHSNSPVPEIKEDVPEALKNVVYKAMSKSKEERYQESAEMLLDIKNIMKGEAAQFASAPPRRASRVEKNLEKVSDSKNTKLINTICIAAIAVVVVIILVLGISFVSSWIGGGANEPENPNGITEGLEKDGIEIINVVNEKKDNAVESLEKQGFKVTVKDAVTDDETEVDRVIAQLPAAGSKLEKGEEVIIFIGKKTENEEDSDFLELEKVVGMTEAEASVLLESAGFKVSVEYKELSENDSDKDGIVLEQNPLGGEKLKKGSTVGLKIGKKAESEPESNQPENPDNTASPKPNDSDNTPSSTPEVTQAPPLAKTETVGLVVPEGAGEQRVKVTVDGVPVLEGTYSAGQSVSVNVSVESGKNKMVIFYVNDRVVKQREVSF